ncbi:uncharacterized protein LOC118853055 [Trichosurus vulpecula]|uniref:uncharacterized protein LOC118853055 n=1 Tax=Trichosurus vulpecula TaxID=9337 RepID=UPI00186B3E6E|nr:uncharacterized protein LOC118853055 [Trichosurus vulpecula]
MILLYAIMFLCSLLVTLSRRTYWAWKIMTNISKWGFWFMGWLLWSLNKCFDSSAFYFESFFYPAIPNLSDMFMIFFEIINSALLIHLASRTGSLGIRSLFRSRTIPEEEINIPGWEDPFYSSLAKELAKKAGPCENWEPRLRRGDPRDLEKCLREVGIQSGASLSRQSWIVLSAYRLVYERLRLSERHGGTPTPQEEGKSQIAEDQTDSNENFSINVAKSNRRPKKPRVHFNPAQKEPAEAQNTTGVQDVPHTENRRWLNDQTRARPIQRRKTETRGEDSVTREIQEDFSPQEVTDILSRFSQRIGEPLISWMVRLSDQGAGGISVDGTDCMRFIGISHDPLVQQAFREHHQQGDGDSRTTLLALAAVGCNKRYDTDSMWPTEHRPWYSLRDCIMRLKEEVMKTAIMIGTADKYYNDPMGLSHRNLIIRTAPPAYKQLILNLLLGEVGSRLTTVINKILQLYDLGDWGRDRSPRERRVNNQQTWRQRRVTRKEMFTTLLRAGVGFEMIDGIPTNELYRMYRGLDNTRNREIRTAPASLQATQTEGDLVIIVHTCLFFLSFVLANLVASFVSFRLKHPALSGDCLSM